MDLIEIFYHTDEFCKHNLQKNSKSLLSNGKGKRKRKMKLSLSEVMTIAIYFHFSEYKNFKSYYKKCQDLKTAFPKVSYTRFIELKQKIAPHLAIFLRSNGLINCSGISFIDSIPLKSAHIRREYSHETFKNLAKKGQTSVGWFFGFKIHFVINHRGEVIDFCLTSGNIADNNHEVLNLLTSRISGKVYGDKGYLLKENFFREMFKKGVHIITKVRKNMKGKIMSLEDKLLLKKRGLIESVIAVLKEDLMLEHSRHRSISSFVSHICSTFIAYAFRKKKPSLQSIFEEANPCLA